MLKVGGGWDDVVWASSLTRDTRSSELCVGPQNHLSESDDLHLYSDLFSLWHV